MRTMAVVSTLVLVGALVAQGPVWAAEPVDKPAAADKKAENTAGKKANKKDARVISTSPDYLGLDPIYTTILDGDIIAGTLMLGIGLDIPDPQLRDSVSTNMPMLRDLYVRTMLSYTAVNIRPWRQPDVEDIAARLQSVTDRKLKRKGVRVLLAQVAIRLNR